MNYRDINENNLQEYWDYTNKLTVDDVQFWIIYIHLANYQFEPANRLLHLYLKSEGVNLIKGRILTNNEFQNFISETSDMELSESLHIMGLLYDEGIGREKNEEKAIEYYQRAINKGNSRAMSKLASKLINRKEKDKEKAIDLYLMALKKGNPETSRIFSNLFSNEPRYIMKYMQKKNEKINSYENQIEKMKQYHQKQLDEMKQLYEKQMCEYFSPNGEGFQKTMDHFDGYLKILNKKIE